MSVKILRWPAGAGGDTLLKLAVLSDSNLSTNVKFAETDNVNRTKIDVDASNQFEYKQITKMGMYDAHTVDLQLLKQELLQFEGKHQGDWILKSHCYDIIFDQEVIDIVVTKDCLPFVVHASVVKNPRSAGLLQYNHPMIEKIKDQDILNKFDIFNIAKNELTRQYGDNHILLKDMLSGWYSYSNSTKQTGIYIDNKFEVSYNIWLDANKKFMPSEKYLSLLANNKLDYESDDLSLVEKYCLLALSGKKFRILT
jgi:hypothetical protein